MTLLLHVNEASVMPLQSREESDRVALAFAALILAIKRRRGDVALVSVIPLSEVTFFGHHALGEWGSSPTNRDRWRVVRLMQSKSPGWHGGRDDTSSEYRAQGQGAIAFGDAHMSGGLLISFGTSSIWDVPWVRGTRNYLAESDGEVQLMSEDVEVRNGSSELHVGSHVEWITLASTTVVESGSDLLSKCPEMFTMLKFLPRAEAQLDTLDPRWLVPVAQSLALINRALVEWPTDSAYPTWYTHVTPESESRRTAGLLDFQDFDGVVRTFDTHARFTPGAGRIHFRLDNATRTATVAHIGVKIV